MDEQLKANTNIVSKLVNSDEAKVPLILSDETKVIRWDRANGKYNLTLKHNKDSIDLERSNILKLFYQHDTHGNTPPIGRIDNVRLEDGKLKADAYFDKEDKFAMQIFGKIERGFLESVSVGITIHDGYMTEKKSKSIAKEYTATKWELNEVSIVNIPAIPTAGVGLSQQNNTKGNQMDLSGLTVEALTDSRPELVAELKKMGFEDGKSEGFEMGKAEGAKLEAKRIADIENVAMAGYEDIILAAKADGKSTAQDVKLAIFDEMQKTASSAKDARAEDGATLAAHAKELITEPTTDDKQLAEEKAAAEMMAKAGKKARGEK